MKRDIDRCYRCRRMMTCKQGSRVIGYFCCWSQEKPSGIHMKFIDGDMVLFAGASTDSIVVEKEKWNGLDVPRDCDFYADYFLEECNEEKS